MIFIGNEIPTQVEGVSSDSNEGYGPGGEDDSVQEDIVLDESSDSDEAPKPKKKRPTRPGRGQLRGAIQSAQGKFLLENGVNPSSKRKASQKQE